MQAVVAALRDNDRFVVTSHEAPDGDALGSMLATGLALEQAGKDVVMFLGGEAPLPGEYRFLELEQRGLRRERPDDFRERVLVAVDCASPGRVGAEPGIFEAAPFTVNIDHHHDNPRFGDVDLVVADASSTGEVLADVFRELGVELTPEIAEALYIALVTDTGRFQYAQHNAEGAPSCRRPRRGGCGRPPRLPGRLRERPVREAEAARAGSRPRACAGGR